MTDEREIARRLRKLPPIRRARLWRLYGVNRGANRSRFLDLWMDGGRAILGAKGTGLGTAAKAAVDMGLLRPMPSAWERRLSSQLRLSYPEYAAARFFRTDERALAAVGAVSVFDPARRTAAAHGGADEKGADTDAAAPRRAFAIDVGRTSDLRVLVLRPFARYLGDQEAEAFPIALPLLPCPRALSPSVLLFRDEKDASMIEGDTLPPVLLSAAHRALGELIRMRSWYDEKLWEKTDRRLGKYFERRGPYLYLRGAGAAGGAVWEGGYEAAFDAALKAGVLLSPDPELPSIVPGDFDDGELAALAAALAGSQRP